MTSPLFRSIAGAARGAVERIHGSAVMVHPMDRRSGPNGAREPSLDRPAFASIACFYEDSTLREASDLQPRMLGGTGRLLHNSPVISASLRLSETSSTRSGDLMQRLDDGQWFEIGPMKPDGLGGVMVELSRSAGLTDAGG